jgi:hypothetical protein
MGYSAHSVGAEQRVDLFAGYLTFPWTSGNDPEPSNRTANLPLPSLWSSRLFLRWRIISRHSQVLIILRHRTDLL